MKRCTLLLTTALLSVLLLPFSALGLTIQENTQYDISFGEIFIRDTSGTTVVLRDFDPRGILPADQRYLSGTFETGALQNGVLSSINFSFDQARDNVYTAYNQTGITADGRLQVGSQTGAPVIEGLSNNLMYFALSTAPQTISYGDHGLDRNDDLLLHTTDQWPVSGMNPDGSARETFGIVNGGGALTPTLHSERYALYPSGKPANLAGGGIVPFTAWLTSDGQWQSWAFAEIAGQGVVRVDFRFNISERAPDTEIPEPATAALLGCGLLGSVLRRRKQKEIQ